MTFQKLLVSIPALFPLKPFAVPAIDVKSPVEYELLMVLPDKFSPIKPPTNAALGALTDEVEKLLVIVELMAWPTNPPIALFPIELTEPFVYDLLTVAPFA